MKPKAQLSLKPIITAGDPGSKFYDNFIDTWMSGKYYPLWIMKPSEKNDKRIQWTMMFSKM